MGDVIVSMITISLALSPIAVGVGVYMYSKRQPLRTDKS